MIIEQLRNIIQSLPGEAVVELDVGVITGIRADANKLVVMTERGNTLENAMRGSVNQRNQITLSGAGASLKIGGEWYGMASLI